MLDNPRVVSRGSLARVMWYQEDSWEVWKFLYQRQGATTPFSKATVHPTLAWMKYAGEPMQELRWESCSAHHAPMDSPMVEAPLVTVITEFFGDRANSPNGMTPSALITKEPLTWQALTSRLLQEYSSQNATKSTSFPSLGQRVGSFFLGRWNHNENKDN